MQVTCANCGRVMDEFELSCGPDGLGCTYCVQNCPRCGKEVYVQDIIQDEDGACCIYCENN